MSDTSPLPPEAYKALADLLGGSGKVIAYRSYFAHAFGGACNAILLSQFWFWSNTPTVKTRAGGWFWKSQKEITLETGLTRTETATTRRKLIALGVLKEDNRGCPATLHYQVVKDVLYEVLWMHILKNPEEFDEILQSAGIVQNLQTGSPKTSKVTRGKRANQNPQKLQAITETSSEKTKRINQRVAPAGAPRADKISSLSLSQIAEQKQKEPVTTPLTGLVTNPVSIPVSIPAPEVVSATMLAFRRARREMVGPEFIRKNGRPSNEQDWMVRAWEIVAEEKAAAEKGEGTV